MSAFCISLAGGVSTISKAHIAQSIGESNGQNDSDGSSIQAEHKVLLE